ncbi:hypothetical protein AB0I22_39190, partial [Streptomyces sp. NPDC050610]|uniref:hypothetical protein n=1 Tax=Streptomyces sp. NPDC050610 TaxID=3157097 RepID=UPI00343D4D2A
VVPVIQHIDEIRQGVEGVAGLGAYDALGNDVVGPGAAALGRAQSKGCLTYSINSEWEAASKAESGAAHAENV